VAVTPLEKRDLETVIAFEQFPESKTAINIAEWLKTSHTKAGLKLEYIMCHPCHRWSLKCSRFKHGIPNDDACNKG
jgi:hypothetical protein